MDDFNDAITKVSWPSAPANPTLAPDEIHLWCARLDRVADYDRYESWLSNDETARAQRIRFSCDRRRFMVRRAVLRATLGHYLGLPPRSLAFRYTERGKPLLANALNEAITFNLTHSRGLSLFAFARGHALGIDVEQLRSVDDMEAVATQFFSDVENAALRRVTASNRTEAFFNCWTRKEAFLKATGEGLQRSLKSFDVTLLPGEPAQLIGSESGDAADWTLHGLSPAVGFIGALAAPAGSRILRYWEFPESFRL